MNKEQRDIKKLGGVLCFGIMSVTLLMIAFFLSLKKELVVFPIILTLIATVFHAVMVATYGGIKEYDD